MTDDSKPIDLEAVKQARIALKELVEKHPELTEDEAQERLREHLEKEDE